MDAVSSVTKEMFRRYFIAALVSIGIPLDQANLFCCMNQRKRLMDFGICTVISMKLDEFMESHNKEEENQDEQIMKILTYLTEWLVNHILYVDGQIPQE